MKRVIGTPMTDAQVRQAIVAAEPRLNRNAVHQMMVSFQLPADHKPPKDCAEVRAKVAAYIARANQELVRLRFKLANYDAVDSINESADELAFEAKAS